jgi:two-component system capsular synthesis sensor histidine kinase RcsC
VRFLIVDDEPEVRRLLRDNIVRWGHAADLAEGGAACLAACAESVPDVLLLDVAMPGLDGPAVLAALRARGHEPRHVVLVSAVPAGRQRELAERLGVRVLSKPFDVEALERFLAPILTA